MSPREAQSKHLQHVPISDLRSDPGCKLRICLNNFSCVILNSTQNRNQQNSNLSVHWILILLKNQHFVVKCSKQLKNTKLTKNSASCSTSLAPKAPKGFQADVLFPPDPDCFFKEKRRKRNNETMKLLKKHPGRIWLTWMPAFIFGIFYFPCC